MIETKTTNKRGVTVLELSGRLVIASGDVVLRDLFRRTLADGARRVVIDLTDVAYMDSSGVAEIVACTKRAGDAAAVLRIVAPATGRIRRVLEITHLDKALEVYTSVDDAVAAFA